MRPVYQFVHGPQMRLLGYPSGGLGGRGCSSGTRSRSSLLGRSPLIQRIPAGLISGSGGRSAGPPGATAVEAVRGGVGRSPLSQFPNKYSEHFFAGMRPAYQFSYGPQMRPLVRFGDPNSIRVCFFILGLY